MPSCAAVDCFNSTKKGFRMKRFPRDPIRRAVWAEAMERDQFVPTDNDNLCEVHFAPEMWETTRVDGKRRLKADAVPTIFWFNESTSDFPKITSVQALSGSRMIKATPDVHPCPIRDEKTFDSETPGPCEPTVLEVSVEKLIKHRSIEASLVEISLDNMSNQRWIKNEPSIEDSCQYGSNAAWRENEPTVIEVSFEKLPKEPLMKDLHITLWKYKKLCQKQQDTISKYKKLYKNAMKRNERLRLHILASGASRFNFVDDIDNCL